MCASLPLQLASVAFSFFDENAVSLALKLRGRASGCEMRGGMEFIRKTASPHGHYAVWRRADGHSSLVAFAVHSPLGDAVTVTRYWAA
jgi:hypothetical protein